MISSTSKAASTAPATDFKAPFINSINTIADLINWQSLKDGATVSRIALAPRAPLPASAMPSMVGFDSGEFTYDEWSTLWSQGACGSNIERSAANCYNFGWWQYIDISYYYSHRLLAVPPTVWTNAAHKNGVLSLGTLGLNWTENWPTGRSPNNPKYFSEAQVVDFLTEKPANADPSKLYLEDAINLLDEVRLYYGFDGYLVNLEDQYSAEILAKIRPNMLKLLSALKERGCQMMWYDSPFSNAPDWFAQYLNDKQYDFFVATGHFQTDYHWMGSAGTMPSASWDTLIRHDQANALENRKKVFTGLYTSRFAGGNPPYGGTFFPAMHNLKSDKSKPDAPPDFYTGFCLYYPAWTMYDMRTGPDKTILPTREEFMVTDQAFWTGTKDIIGYPQPGVNPVAPDQCMKHYLFERTVIKSMPFVSTFNDGQGDFYNIEGASYSDGPWNNLSDQSVLPSFRFTFDDQIIKSNNTRIIHNNSEEVYSGGSSLLVDLKGATGSVKLDLFRTAIKLTSSTVVRLIIKGGSQSRTVTPLLWINYGSVVPLAKPNISGLNNSWYQVDFSIPTDLIGETVGKIQLEIQPGTNPGIIIGQFSMLDLVPPGAPRQPWLQDFPADSTVLDWTSLVVDPNSYYRVWGLSKDVFHSVLLGVVYNNVYRVAYGSALNLIPATNIFNTKFKRFDRYTVQEVNSAGASTPL